MSELALNGSISIVQQLELLPNTPPMTQVKANIKLEYVPSIEGASSVSIFKESETLMITAPVTLTVEDFRETSNTFTDDNILTINEVFSISIVLLLPMGQASMDVSLGRFGKK